MDQVRVFPGCMPLAWSRYALFLVYFFDRAGYPGFRGDLVSLLQ